MLYGWRKFMFMRNNEAKQSGCSYTHTDGNHCVYGVGHTLEMHSVKTGETREDRGTHVVVNPTFAYVGRNGLVLSAEDYNRITMNGTR